MLHRRKEQVVAAKAVPNPASSVFTVQVIPADTTVIPASATSAADKEKQEYRQLTLRFSMPASEFKITQSDSGQYVARLEISADGYTDGMSLETYASPGGRELRWSCGSPYCELHDYGEADGDHYRARSQPLARCERSRSVNRTVWQPDHPPMGQVKTPAKQ
jgi:hypothetical protein